MGTSQSKPSTSQDAYFEKRAQQASMVVEAAALADTLATVDLNELAMSETGKLEGGNLKEWEHSTSKVSLSRSLVSMHRLTVHDKPFYTPFKPSNQQHYNSN